MTKQKIKTMTTVDCTPTWEGLLPLMLDLVKQDSKMIVEEFKKMAKAADKYNELINQKNNEDGKD